MSARKESTRISPVRARWATLTAFAKFKLATDLEADNERLERELRHLRAATFAFLNGWESPALTSMPELKKRIVRLKCQSGWEPGMATAREMVGRENNAERAKQRAALEVTDA